MLTYLDTAIGFMVVMLAVSLLITTLTQMISAMVNHRGSNLQWGLKTIFANIDPGRFPTLATQADSLAREVLSHCLISDSWFSGNRVAERLGAKVPLLQKWFDRFRLASAIRPSELSDILRELAAAKTRQAASAPADEAQVLKTVAREIGDLLAQADPAAARDVEMVAAAAAALPGGVALVAPAANAVQAAVDHASASIGRLEVWFGSMMDRVSQKFAMYMRIWTVAFGAVFAFGTGTNSVKLLDDLYTHGAFRNALVAAAPQVTSAAATMQSATAAQASGASDADKKAIQDGLRSAAELEQITAQAGFKVVQLRWPDDFGQRPIRSKLQYLLGVLMTAALLSLGAPFWFNALKSISNLRPVVASKEAAGN